VNTVVVATSEQDAAAAEAVVQHHAIMAGALAGLTERVVAASGNETAAQARDELVHWSVTELLPHARAEEEALYPLAAAEGRLLVESMLGEHEVIEGLVEKLRSADTPMRAAATANALRVIFESHLTKENDLILPLVAQTPGVSLADALRGMHELLEEEDGHGEHGHGEHGHGEHGHGEHGHGEHGHGEHGHGDHAHGDHAHHGHDAHPVGAAAAEGHGHSCTCGEVDGPELPELDARAVPHAIRHATIFGALDAVRPGGGLVLVAPHDPLPLLQQVEQRAPGAFSVDYLERGPEAWRLRFLRTPA
jgi:uncharacterized protein (DUF2249 family)/iron-sulfur cluster repair protein YtfE (RIC family)